MRNTNRALAEAYQLDQRGRLAEAVEAYRQLITYEPNNSDALHLLGVALARSARPQEALETLTRAAALQPENPYIQMNLGNALSELGRPAQALAAFERAVALKEDFAPALQALGRAQLRLGHSAAAEASLVEAVRLMPANGSAHSDLGVALERLDRPAEALAHFERATILNPNLAEAHHNRGVLEAAQGQPQQALASLDRALQLQPRQAAIHANRGNVLADLGRNSEALASFDQALALEPRNAAALRTRGRLRLPTHPLEAVADLQAALALEPKDFTANFQLGVALTLLERDAEALESFERALVVTPGSAEALNNRGAALVRLDRSQEALESFRRALEIAPRNVQALINGANTLAARGGTDEALQWFDRALHIQPDAPELAWGKARLLLSLGHFKEGWLLYESRLQLAHLRPLQRHVAVPRWNGTGLSGETLLVYAEQGLGDTLQFCRLVPLLEARGVEVVFEVQPSLAKLLRSLAMQGEIRAVGEALPPFAHGTPLLSLPLLLGTEIDSIPATVPYLHSDTSRTDVWRQRLAQLPGLKVGIAWQGNVETEKQGGFAGRSFPLAAAAALAGTPGVTLISLQKGAGSEQCAQAGFEVLELADPHDIGADEVLETAALMTALDLVVTSDTLSAHLAGALGVPVWVVLAASADWRWLRGRDDSPWYPTMRLFRQSRPKDWVAVFQDVAAAVARLRESQS